MSDFDFLNVIALIWFLLLWGGYTWFADWYGQKTDCLASELHRYRLAWMRNLLMREMRVPDTTIIANLERNVSFFASSCMLIIAGLLTVTASTDRALEIVSALPWVQTSSTLAWELRLLSLVVLFVFAFFKFTWALRQVGFCSVLVGSAPLPSQSYSDEELEQYARGAADVLSLAGQQFNHGLRSFYFGLAMLAWFINPWLFMLASFWVVVVLYFREFRSEALKALVKADIVREGFK
jgi:uncharacterized membrane protein